MSIQFETHHVIAPTLWVYQGDRWQASHRGTVFFYHGLGSCKDQQHQELISLAERGFLAIGVDNMGHGERRYADFDQRFGGQNPHFGQELLSAVDQSAQELPCLVDALLDSGWIQADRLGLIGVSMGGYIAYAAALAERRLKAVSVILGSPNWWEFSEKSSQSPHLQPERFYPLAILSQNAGQDTSVRPHFAREFHQRLVPFYTEQAERQHYIEYPESGHFMRESDWHHCWQKNLSWLEQYLD